MGFYEDDRIKRKNSTHNAAFNLVQNLMNEGIVEPTKIEEYLRTADPAQGRPDRNEIYLTVMSIVRGSQSSGSKNTS